MFLLAYKVELFYYFPFVCLFQGNGISLPISIAQYVFVNNIQIILSINCVTYCATIDVNGEWCFFTNNYWCNVFTIIANPIKSNSGFNCYSKTDILQ